MITKSRYINYLDYLASLYKLEWITAHNDLKDYKAFPVINVVFLVTDDCCCQCTYCYLINKLHNMMSFDTVEKSIDMLFDMYYSEDNTIINNNYNMGIALEFIGGEPLMNIDSIDKCCSYFFEKAISLHHPWAVNWTASMISNGKYYFDKRFLNFLEKFSGHIHYNVTIDGPKEMHDHCRVYKDGSGNFDDAWKALRDYYAKYPNATRTTKITIAPENLAYLNKTVLFFLNNNIPNIISSLINEHLWTIDECKTYYKQLKDIANFLLELSDCDYDFSVFNDFFYRPLPEDNLECWCGGDGRMLAFDTGGKIYPCIRYMEASLNKNVSPVCIGDCTKGFCYTEEQKEKFNALISMNRRTQNTDECFYCPIASGCSTCIANDYLLTGELGGKRVPNICNMHKAASLAACYFWNQYYKKYNINKSFHRYLSNEEALKIISEEELNMLDSLEKENI